MATAEDGSRNGNIDGPEKKDQRGIGPRRRQLLAESLAISRRQPVNDRQPRPRLGGVEIRPEGAPAPGTAGLLPARRRRTQ
jgi:hypothetical protein